MFGPKMVQVIEEVASEIRTRILEAQDKHTNYVNKHREELHFRFTQLCE